MSKKSLKELDKKIAEFVKASEDKEKGIVKIAESYSRQDYINHIQSVLVGAAREVYKCCIHDKLKAEHKDRAHWEKEWRYHLGKKLQDEIDHPIKFSDRKKAVLSAIDGCIKSNATFLNSAANTMAKYLGKSATKMRVMLTDDDTEMFYKEVATAAEQYLADPFVSKVDNKSQKK